MQVIVLICGKFTFQVPYKTIKIDEQNLKKPPSLNNVINEIEASIMGLKRILEKKSSLIHFLKKKKQTI